MSILSLNEATLVLANQYILSQANLQIQPRDRIALVGRNGAGKSTLLSVLQGNLHLDSGQMRQRAGLNVAGLIQEVPSTREESVYHFLVKSLGERGEILSEFHRASLAADVDQLVVCQEKMDAAEAWGLLPQIETMATRLGIDSSAPMAQLSGGMKRRVLLGAALIARPDLLLLDEPTNHLDMESIEWLESYLKNFSGSVVVVTHDREFLAQVANRIVEMDRGKLQSHECTYETYLDRREALRLSEERQNDLLDKRLAEEEVWLRTGVKARRTRNEGRVRALNALREQCKARRKQMGSVKSLALDVNRSGSTVVEAEHLNYALQGKTLIADFSLLLTRGDKLGIIGPNGCGKTTLVRLLLGELSPDSGNLRQGTGLDVAYFDQLRRRLEEDKTLMYNVGEGADYVTINGQQKHVASYLRDFLFQPERFNQPVSSLSGGERNRLLLAKLFAKPVNFLVMDEPTNDLDIETLELLENMLLEYPGTLILISHDRAFINQVVTSVLVYEGEGHFAEFFGAYNEYKRYHKKKKESSHAPSIEKEVKKQTRLSLNEQRELMGLPNQIERLEKKIAEYHSRMVETNFYQQQTEKITQIARELQEQEDLLKQMYLRWEELVDRE